MIYLEKYKIPIPPERMHDALYYSSLYIGEGATMASECAVLGTPAIYANNLSAGTLEEQRSKYGLVFYCKNSNEIIGEVSSGTFSPILNSGIGLAYIKTKRLPENNSLFVDIRGKKTKAKVVDIPFTNSKALK